MSKDLAVQIGSLPGECRQRAVSFLEEGQYYGWKLESVQTKPLGDFMQCTLDFDQERIVFLSPRRSTTHAHAPAW